MKKIALINQRYGKEVNGGSEYYTMLMAQKLNEYYEVEVLTSKALTYEKWADYYQMDNEIIDGVIVRRFGVKWKRNRYIQRILKIFITRFGMNTDRITALWNKVLGPYVPELVEYIRRHKAEYDAFIFVTYMYYPTVFGMKEAGDKAILVPTAHDEYNIYFKIYEKVFHIPRKIVYLTEEEKNFVQRQFHNDTIESQVIGVGVNVPENVSVERFRTRYGIEGDYIIYAGRVDAEKGCKEMFEYFSRYVKETESLLKLIVIGTAYMDIPKEDSIHYLGFVPEEDKYDAIKGAKVLWLPSRFESLSIAVLEAMALAVPVIVNGNCEVLKGHCEKSGGGRSYTDYKDFVYVLSCMKRTEYKKYSERAKNYIDLNYSWDSILERWISIILS